MSPDQWRKLKEVFGKAKAMPSEAQAEFVHSACVDDAELCTELLSLLAAHRAAEPVLEPPRSPAALGSTIDPADSLVGQRIAGYSLIRVLGRGGMGTVYSARSE